MDLLTIKNRTYTVIERDRHIEVCGKFVGGSNRMLPGLLDVLGETLRTEYPVQHWDGACTLNEAGDKMVFNYVPAQTWRMVREAFIVMFKELPQAKDLLARGEVIDRRFYLAESVGLALSRHKFLSDPTAELRRKWDALVEQRWEQYEHRFKPLLFERAWFPHEPRMQVDFSIKSHQYHKKDDLSAVTWDDLRWLWKRVIEVVKAVRDVGRQVFGWSDNGFQQMCHKAEMMEGGDDQHATES